MANVSVTTGCNRDCVYCFAAAERRASPGHMSLATYARTLDFLERSGIGEARLLGGEPTLHPEFPRLGAMALERGLNVLVFSNGHMPEPSLRWLESQPPDRATVLINAREGDSRQRMTLSRLRDRAALGLNIHEPAFEPAFLLDLIAEYGLSPRIRLGLAHPAAGASNSFLDPRRYRAAGKRLAELIEAALSAGVNADLDCGFVPCMFPPGFLEALGPAAAGAGTRCSPILDILPGGQVVACYPLAGLAREPAPERDTAGRLRERFTARFSGYRRLGIFPECSACGIRRSGGCNGGCLSAAMRRLRPAADVPLVEIAPPTPTPRLEAPPADQTPAC